MSVRILLIAKEGKERDRYLEAVARLGVEVTAVSDFRRIGREAAGVAYHGVMVDLYTKIKALRKNREFVYGILGQFPLAQLKIDRHTGRIRVFHYRRKRDGSVEEFIREECMNAEPRRFRYHPRKPVHFNTLLFRGFGDAENAPLQTVTLNVSKGGCFLFTTAPWRVGEACRFVFRELSDPAPIGGEVRHVVPWGEPLCVPGIGVEFTDIRQGQEQEIAERFLQMDHKAIQS